MNFQQFTSPFSTALTANQFTTAKFPQNIATNGQVSYKNTMYLSEVPSFGTFLCTSTSQKNILRSSNRSLWLKSYWNLTYNWFLGPVSIPKGIFEGKRVAIDTEFKTDYILLKNRKFDVYLKKICSWVLGGYLLR